MQKIYFLSLLIFFNISVCFAQNIITLQPDSDNGKDALLHGLYSETNKNYGENGQLASDSWTFGGEPGILRSVIDFNLKQIPESAIITSAKLSLYAWDSNDYSLGLHWFSDGSNASWLERVTNSWSESTVTWNNQPSTTPANRVNLLQSTSQTQNYLDIDVTQLVQDMVDKPDSSFGFMLKLQTEDGMRRMNFCSSDHLNNVYHPKLVVAYTLSSNTPSEIVNPKLQDVQFSIYPNPAIEFLCIKTLNLNQTNQLKFVLVNCLGQTIKQISLNRELTNVALKNIDSGIYIYQILDNNNSLKSGKIVIEK